MVRLVEDCAIAAHQHRPVLSPLLCPLQNAKNNPPQEGGDSGSKSTPQAEAERRPVAHPW